ncbi:MAG TPA: PP2C family serine/threonine-protein phosphatase [Longimicrobiales bacterium]|nr:PP2C family serine/threonine-protein phosphatase [Longimicrobiales bacterium]
MNFTFAGLTNQGRVRERNEDALLQRPERGLFAVADGMGGHAAGDVASRVAVDVLDEHTLAAGRDPGRADLASAIGAAHRAILRAARAEPQLHGMGTTLTALRIGSDGSCTIAHVGDSRAYRLREGSFEQLTRDQTWVQEQVEAGALTPAQARRHPFAAVITCALGIEDVRLDIQLLEPPCAAGDLFLLCSDGLTARLEDEDLADLLAGREDLEEAARTLVDAANAAGGPDNITVLLVRISADDEQPAGPPR